MDIEGEENAGIASDEDPSSMDPDGTLQAKN
jgi:hypothetical protein